MSQLLRCTIPWPLRLWHIWCTHVFTFGVRSQEKCRLMLTLEDFLGSKSKVCDFPMGKKYFKLFSPSLITRSTDYLVSFSIKTLCLPAKQRKMSCFENSELNKTKKSRYFTVNFKPHAILFSQQSITPMITRGKGYQLNIIASPASLKTQNKKHSVSAW